MHLQPSSRSTNTGGSFARTSAGIPASRLRLGFGPQVLGDRQQVRVLGIAIALQRAGVYHRRCPVS